MDSEPSEAPTRLRRFLSTEVRNPARTIPRAMLISFSIVTVTYAGLAAVLLALATGGAALGPAPLATVAELEPYACH